jgi:hypothetical protein
MRNPRSKPANARPRPVPPGAARARKSSTSTNAKPLCATSPRGTPSARRSSTAAPPKDGIEPFDQLIDQFMSQHPYRRAQRVFLIIDSGSAHRGKRSIDCLQGTWKNMTVVHTPVHASWLNQPKSTSPSSNAKSSNPTTSPTSTPSNNSYWTSADATNKSLHRSNGSSPARTSTSSWPKPTPSPPP